MNPLEIIQIIFDRRHVKDPRTWVIFMLMISFGFYHCLVIKPMKARMERQGKALHILKEAAKTKWKLDFDSKEER